MTDRTKLVHSAKSQAEMHRLVDQLYKQHGYCEFHWSTERQRTLTQSNALHLFCEWLAETLNDAGLDMRAVIKEDVDIPWSKDSVKTYLWKPLQKAMLEKESTTEANRTDYSEVYDVLARHMASKHGVEIPPWPSVDREY